MENNTLDFLESNSTSNDTPIHYINKDLKKAENILAIIFLIISMIAMGADISWNQIYKQFRKPVGPAIGLFCQFVIMPLNGFLYNVIFQFESTVAAGLLIISCCPGGAISNLFTYYLDGDVSLSVTMTTVSIVVCLGMMPLNIWIYASNTEAKKLIIPYGNIALSLLMIVPPVILGMIIKWKATKLSVYITKWGSATTVLMIIVFGIIEVISFHHMFNLTSWKIIVTSLLSPLTGMVIGYVIAFICRNSKSACKAIAIECGIQNFTVALGIITLSFDTSRKLNKIQKQSNDVDNKENTAEITSLFSSEDSSQPKVA
ncbi:solute carrier family 10 member 6-like isoform X2 [Centruroides sculpturatus]|uniref:solute carrier family 10 member 6-like isoform X2 n=1 Tax=Centruroides sculpturatus TaxID=218467 RepID=UPI000C6C9FDA|nr:solute carrier family 10 member 6-like isoform X2 [Centruroides sculpturatus]